MNINYNSHRGVACMSPAIVTQHLPKMASWPSYIKGVVTMLRVMGQQWLK
jgi:hypothetical protein